MGTTPDVRAFLRDERAVALLDMMVGCALITTFAVVFATVFGLRSSRAHSSAMSLEMALAEARNLAAANANSLNPGYPTGAMVVVESDPTIQGASRIAVYRSRPVIIDNKQPYAPTRDIGFPAQRVSGQFSFTALGATTTTGNITANQGVSVSEPFAIMLSGSGYASIVPLAGAYDETNPQTFSVDPGCTADNAQIVVADGYSSEAHPFGCTGGVFHAS